MSNERNLTLSHSLTWHYYDERSEIENFVTVMKDLKHIEIEGRSYRIRLRIFRRFQPLTLQRSFCQR